MPGPGEQERRGAGEPLDAVVSPASAHRPAAPPAVAAGGRGLALLVPAAIALALLAPLLPHLGTELAGRAGTDAIRGAWSLDHVRRSLLPPDFLLWSHEVHFPPGVLALVLPLVSGVLLAPVGWLAGPIAGWNLSVLLLVWAAGAATAVLAERLTGSAAAGAVAGAATMTTPMFLHAVADGTPEHVALWLLPVGLALLHRGVAEARPSTAALAGAALAALGLESPYYAVFALLPVVVVVATAAPRALRVHGARDLGATLAAAGATALAGAALLAALYSNFDVGALTEAERKDLLVRNAADLRTWWRAEHAGSRSWDPTLLPTAIPSPVLGAAVLLALVGGRAGLAWALAGLVMVGLSFGLNPYVDEELASWIAAPGEWLGRAILAVNRLLYGLPPVDRLRFPARWLVPAAMALALGAAHGLARMERRLRRVPGAAVLLALLLSGGALWAGARTAHHYSDFPSFAPPRPAFALWIRSRPGAGAVLALPRQRPAPAAARREQMPVFAHLPDVLSSADLQWFQVLHGRPVLDSPRIKTLALFARDEESWRLLRNWDDLAQPALTGNPIPRSAWDPSERGARHRIAARLHEAGLRWIVLDAALFSPEALDTLRSDLGDLLADERRFDDGTGVIVLELTEP